MTPKPNRGDDGAPVCSRECPHAVAKSISGIRCALQADTWLAGARKWVGGGMPCRPQVAADEAELRRLREAARVLAWHALHDTDADPHPGKPPPHRETVRLSALLVLRAEVNR